MPKKLVIPKWHEPSNTQILDKTSKLFKLCIDDNLHGDYNFNRLKGNHLKLFQNFIDDTVGKKLTISQVDKLYLRTRGTPVTQEVVNGIQREVMHYGKARSPLRIFGFYQNGYFVVYRIDPTHDVHK